MCELLTIATCEFRIEDIFAYTNFWKMLNHVTQKYGFPKPQFRGFMADEDNANWIVVCTMYFGGPKNEVPIKRRVVFVIGSRAWFAIHSNVFTHLPTKNTSLFVENGGMLLFQCTWEL